ncbi:hypothetical protein [Tunturiibacter lichenicola]|uniref:hypothetical protein n=1 Tax=Tunturiibacter lichenicola TaxID=2051959 RepID=UPI0021B4604E|nr:hypothetical protein [Edaphobacter lichenicola]
MIKKKITSFLGILQEREDEPGKVRYCVIIDTDRWPYGCNPSQIVVIGESIHGFPRHVEVQIIERSLNPSDLPSL